MKLEISWNKPTPLKRETEGWKIYSCNLDRIPVTSGIYIFARYYNSRYYALYVGQSKNMRSRVKGHFSNLKLMDHLKKAKSGKRVLITGSISTRGGQNPDKARNIAERAFIRQFLAEEGHDLVNHKGTKLQRHEILSTGKVKRSFIPSSIYLEKKKGE